VVRVPRDTIVHLTPDGDLVPGEVPGAVRLWPFTQSRRFLWRCQTPKRLDPVNVLVLERSPAAVLQMLTRQGWERPGDGATHRIWVDGRFVRMFDHTALGDRAERVHVRLFPLADATLVAAHHEVADDRGHHHVTSWDRARQVAADALEVAGAARTTPTGVVTPPNLRGVASDGRIWRLIGAPG
jgi:hypothetical protein